MIPVLFIALEFPPLAQTGVHRSAKLTKYLRDFGIDPIVITIASADLAKSFKASLDQALCDDLPKDLAVYEIESRLDWPSRLTSRLARFLTIYLRVDDPFERRLRRDFRRRLPEIVQRHNPRAVYVSMPPFSAGRMATRIADELKIPVIVDMRDGWSHYCVGGFSTYAHFRLTLRRERQVFKSAARVVTVTEPLAAVFRRTHPTLAHSKFKVIPNGYDVNLTLPDTLQVPSRPLDAKITIGYVGRYYYDPVAHDVVRTPWWRRRAHHLLQYSPVLEDWRYRSPEFFFRTLAMLRRRDPDLGKRIRFVHIGEKPYWFDAMVSEHGLSDAVECLGFLPQAQVHREIMHFDAQLCTAVKIENGEDYALASKTFDYVRTGRPILGLVPRGAQRDFLSRSGLAVVADPDDVEASVSALEQIARGGFVLRPDRAFLAQFDRRAIASEMAQTLREVVADHGQSGQTGAISLPATEQAHRP